MELAKVSKAIAGAVATALVAYLANNNIVLEPQYSDAIELLLAGGIGAVIVYLAPRNRD